MTNRKIAAKATTYRFGRATKARRGFVRKNFWAGGQMLQWVDKGGQVQIQKERHRRLDHQVDHNAWAMTRARDNIDWEVGT